MAEKKFIPPLNIEHAQILRGSFRNFSGRATEYNREGDRNFCVVIDEADAQSLFDEGWNIRRRAPREEGDEPTYYLKVNVKFGEYPPNVWLIGANGRKTKLDADMVGQLDDAEFSNVDLVIRPYNWHANGKSGISAYLKTMYATIQPADPFAEKYTDESSDGIPW